MHFYPSLLSTMYAYVHGIVGEDRQVNMLASFCPTFFQKCITRCISFNLLLLLYILSGATESVGKHMLEACNNNLEMAVTMFLDGGALAEEPSTSSSSAGASSHPSHPTE